MDPIERVLRARRATWDVGAVGLNVERTVMPLFGMGTRGDGNLYVAFLQMGEGDCTVVVCPNGKIAMIDCGSMSFEDSWTDQDLRDLLYKQFFYDYRQVDALVLTHPDEDHHNRVVQLLANYDDENPGIAIAKCYYSNALTEYIGTIYNTREWLEFKNLRPLNALTLRVSDVDKDSSPIESVMNSTPLKRGNGIDQIDTRNRVKILDGTLRPSGPECGVYILASNVTEYPGLDDSSTQANRGSIVTSIEFNGQRILVCGDATLNTEKFLVDRQAANISNLTALQIPHHGSADTSSSVRFVQLVNPMRGLISAKPTAKDYHFPRKDAVDRYLSASQTRLKAGSVHKLTQWDQIAQTPTGSNKKGSGGPTSYPEYAWEPEDLRLNRELYCTGSTGTYVLKVPGS